MTTHSNVRLIDAHSFCWTIGRIELPKIDPLPAPSIQFIQLTGDVLPPEDHRDKKGSGTVDFEALAKQRAYIGRLAEERAVGAEQARLKDAGKEDLAKKVCIVSDNHTLGYDLESFELDGSPRKIEVKAVVFGEDLVAFYLTENEWQTSRRESNYWIYLVSAPRSKDCIIRAIGPGSILSSHLTPVVHRAQVRIAT